MLLVIVAVLSSFLDNIAAALIGGTDGAAGVPRQGAHRLSRRHRRRLQRGGSGSVVGDTTTTMMWIDGVSPLTVVEAYVAAVVAFLIFGVPAAMQQHRYSPIIKDAAGGLQIEWARVAIVARFWWPRSANITANLRFPALLDAAAGDRPRRVGGDPADRAVAARRIGR